MTIFIYVAIFIFFLIIRNILDINYKNFIPTVCVLFAVSFIFSKVTDKQDVMVLENEALPFGETLDNEQLIHILEQNGLDDTQTIATTISYKVKNSYEKKFSTPTMDILKSETIDLTIKLQSNYSGNYTFTMPKHNEEKVFKLSKFKSSTGAFALDSKNKLNTNVSDIVLVNKNKAPLKSEDIINISFELTNPIYNKKTKRGINYFIDDKFCISFQNSADDSEKIKLIVNEKEEDIDTLVPLSAKATTVYSDIGLSDIKLSLKKYDSEIEDFEQVEALRLDKNDSYKGGYKSSNTKYEKISTSQKNKSVNLISNRSVFKLSLDHYYSYFLDQNLEPWCEFIVNRAGAIIVVDSKNMEFKDGYYNLILQNISLLKVYVHNKVNTKFSLSYKYENGEVERVEDEYYIVNADGYLVAVTDDKEKNKETNYFIANNIALAPTIGDDRVSYTLTEQVSKNPIVIQLTKSNDKEPYSLLKTNGIKDPEIVKRKLFQSGVDKQENFISLYDINITNNIE